MGIKGHQAVRTYFLVIGVLLIAALYLTHERILLAMGDFLVVRDTLEPADVIHVIAGEDHRTDYAIHIYQQGYGSLIFFTGGWCSFHHLYHGQHGRERALEQGIPTQAIAVDEAQVSSTYSEIVRLKDFINQRKVAVQSVIVVSDPHHMRRAKWAYKRVLGEKVKLEMAPVPFELSPYKQRWWTDEASERMVKDEYIKFVYYYARYQFSWGSLKQWLASLDTD
jgi:uncharacterized SAM-binding protein YcdF (DUF218 family)